MNFNRDDYPQIIGTVEIVCSEYDGTFTLVEMPIIETFEINGEQFALHLDLDYFQPPVPEYWEDYPPGDVTVTHIGTGFQACGWFKRSDLAENIKEVVKKKWESTGYKNFQELANSKGAIPVRGTIKKAWSKPLGGWVNFVESLDGMDVTGLVDTQ